MSLFSISSDKEQFFQTSFASLPLDNMAKSSNTGRIKIQPDFWFRISIVSDTGSKSKPTWNSSGFATNPARLEFGVPFPR